MAKRAYQSRQHTTHRNKIIFKNLWYFGKLKFTLKIKTKMKF